MQIDFVYLPQGRRNRGGKGGPCPPIICTNMPPPPPPPPQKKKIKKKFLIFFFLNLCVPPQSVIASYGPVPYLIFDMCIYVCIHTYFYLYVDCTLLCGGNKEYLSIYQLKRVVFASTDTQGNHACRLCHNDKQCNCHGMA